MHAMIEGSAEKNRQWHDAVRDELIRRGLVFARSNSPAIQQIVRENVARIMANETARCFSGIRKQCPELYRSVFG